ncbi:hypothetical protein RF55_23314 [Lasius niger]|uniref:Uncharacterized protein n=1 Tax=Lasius niger TaxID=67767 RepID=A0A0J7JWP5_LASNI|nr:hypothetical protein RF55_23314 [Lasius niger]
MSVSQEQRTRQLLELEEIGNRKPSQFLRHLRTLAKENVPDSLLRTLWLGRLLTQMQMILATRTDDPLNSVAEQADRIHEMRTKPIVAATVTPTSKTLEEQIKELKEQIATLTTNRSRDRSRGRSRDKRNRSRSKSEEGHCYYHRRFGEKAKKCTQPCTFNTEKEQGSH